MLYSSRTPGGGYKIIYEYANALAEHGNDVTIYFNGSNMYKHIHIIRPIKRMLIKLSVAIRPRWFKLDTRIHKKAVFRYDNDTIEDADAIIATAIETSWQVAKLDASKGKKFYLIQGFENWHTSDEKVGESYNLGMTNIVVARWLNEEVKKYTGQYAEYLPNGIDTSIFRLTRPINERKLHSIALQYRRSAIKGPQYALDVISRIKSKYPDMTINVFSNEPRPQELPSYCNFYHSITPEKVAELNNSSTIFLSTSVKEGFGLPGLEALACGCVLISFAFTGVKEYAIDGVNSLLSEVGDVQGVLNNIDKCFADASLRNQLSSNGVKTGFEKSLLNAQEKFVKLISNNLNS